MDAIQRIMSANSAAELFGKDERESQFKKLQRQVHPDLNPTRVAEATEAFVKLNALYAGETFGAAKLTSFTTKRATWTAGGDVWKASGVRYRSIDGTESKWLAYVAATAATGPFVEGHRNLEALLKALDEDDRRDGTTYAGFFLQVLDRFKLGADKREARVVGSTVENTRWFPLSSFTSMDPRHIAWIARRVLIALDLTHNKGFLHGSPHLEAVLIEPKQHGVMLKDWQYCVRKNDPLALFDPQAKDAYPAWVKDAGATKDGKIDLMVFGDAFEKLALRSSAPYWMSDYFAKMKTNPKSSALDELNAFTKIMDAQWDRKFLKMNYPDE